MKYARQLIKTTFQGKPAIEIVVLRDNEAADFRKIVPANELDHLEEIAQQLCEQQKEKDSESADIQAMQTKVDNTFNSLDEVKVIIP